MFFVGKIDKDLYSCIINDIRTDEVVITENQMHHIVSKHPEAFEKAMECVASAIDCPDFIIQDKNPNTGLVIKSIRSGERYLQLVLRICASSDENTYKNSIISCWIISEKRLQNYLRNKKILYRR